MRFSAALVLAACSLPGDPAGGQALPAAVSTVARPNFVFILIDDLGWTDLGCFGSAFYETPNIDRLAAEGMRFTDAYSACTVCSPTRASILTGKYPARLHLTDWIPGERHPKARLKLPDWTKQLPTAEVSLARALAGAGYVSASIGKWHMGGPEFWPEKHGFAVNVAGCDKGQPPSYFSPYKIPNLTDGPKGEYITDRLTAESIRFIEANRARPFFLYLAHYGVHTPLQAKQELVEKYKGKIRPGQEQKNAVYAAMIESVDESVGKILAKLEELKLAGRTVVLFFSDNGGLSKVTSNKPLRAGKGSAYEGGVRVPLIVRWPGHVKSGSVCRTPVSSVDFYPTFLEMAGIKPPAEQVIDGQSIVGLLRQTGGLSRDAIYWHYPHYHGGGATPYGAVREGDLKLIEFFEDSRLELYNLRDDTGEQRNLAQEMSDKARQLADKLAGWRRAVGAQMPSANPDFGH